MRMLIHVLHSYLSSIAFITMRPHVNCEAAIAFGAQMGRPIHVLECQRTYSSQFVGFGGMRKFMYEHWSLLQWSVYSSDLLIETVSTGRLFLYVRERRFGASFGAQDRVKKSDSVVLLPLLPFHLHWLWFHPALHRNLSLSSMGFVQPTSNLGH
jgi:hypothetical protein